METLSILLSSGGAGETLFVGLIIGLMTWGWMALREKKTETKQKKQDEVTLKLLDDKIVNQGGLIKMKNEIYEYLKNTYILNIEKTENFGVIMSNYQYEFDWVVYGDNFESMMIRFINKTTNIKLDWHFNFNDSQDYIIKKIDSEINNNL